MGGRDTGGRFLPGHTIAKGKRKPGAGAKKLPKTEIKDFLAQDRANLGLYLQKLGELARQGNKDALTYLIDRHLGRPHQSIDQRTRLEIGLTADDYAKERQKALEYEQKLLVEGVSEEDSQ